MGERVEKFTNGPLHVDFGECIRIKDESGTVATVTHVHLTGRRNPEQVIANAHLIAAAPELYEALEETLEQAIACFTHHYGENPEGGSLPEYITKAQSALAKARGES
ncbi:hypothetical protein HK28_00110 [Acetobacter sp. DsW_063]|nr:hypothetical protein HK28_00110 [Acetobacter sp. DsW_063]